MERLLIIEKKGYTFRLLDPDKDKIFRVFERDFKELDFIIGTLFECEYTNTGTAISKLTMYKEFVGDYKKERIELPIDDYKRGDLIDNIPILNFGKAFAVRGVKVAYAYFK